MVCVITGVGGNMSATRDDFTQKTIREVAGRVGYRCSFPECPNHTIGASMENISKVSVTGVAAHICAAAPGGPRYDANMTPAERKSHDNCIWMCQTHARLIDTDETQYTVEKLLTWKREAEERAAKALANPDYWSEYYRNNGDNLLVLTQLFNDMIANGQYDQLKIMLTQYKTVLSEQYEEFIQRYKIIYDAYCDRAKLKEDVEQYCKLPCKNGADILAEIFLEFHLVDELREIKDFCKNATLKDYVFLAIEGKLVEKWLAPIGTTETITFPKEIENTILKSISNYISIRKSIGILDISGGVYKLYAEEFYYQALAAAYELRTNCIYGKGVGDVEVESGFIFIKENIDIILQLDAAIQEYIWMQFLNVIVDNYQMFSKYYQKCPATLKDSTYIQKIKYMCDIRYDVKLINVEDILTYTKKTKDVGILCAYLTCILKDEALQILDDRGYLFREDSVYIKIKLELSDNLSDSEAINFLERYEDIYSNDFTYHCIMAKYSEGIQKKQEVKWLCAHKEEMKTHDFVDFVDLLSDCGCWNELVELVQYPIPNEYIFLLANRLSESEIAECLKQSRKIYQQLINRDWKNRGLFGGLGQVYWKLGQREEAKKCFTKEYEEYKSKSALKCLMQLRYETHEYTMDGIFEKLKECVDERSQNLVAAISLKNNDYVNARKYFLRSLLINDKDNCSINGFYETKSHLSETCPEMINENTVCILKNSEDTLRIAIHSMDILQGISEPCDFAGYIHFSVEDENISPLLFGKKDELVLFKEKEYKIEDIISVNDAIVKYFFSSICENEDVMKITSSSPEELLEQIKPILKKSADSMQRIIDNYNQQSLGCPISLLAKSAGKSILATCEFLAYGNDKKIVNNLTPLPGEKDFTSFVLSYEVIVYLVHIGITLNDLDGVKILCAPQVKNRLLEDINEELASILNNSRAGSMHYEEGKVIMIDRNGEVRRTRHSFLSKMKTLVSKIDSDEEAIDFVATNEEIKDIINEVFKTQKVLCEGGSLGTTKNKKGRVLVTDNQFLAELASAEGIANTGLIPFLLHANLEWRKLLDISKRLKEINYSNYLPLALYKKMVDTMIDSENDLEEPSNEIQMWLISDTDNEPSNHHEDVIVALCKDVITQDLDYLNPDNILGRLAINTIEKRNPGYIQQCIAKVFSIPEDMLVEIESIE